ncbi:MAG: DNA replication/repair protein RecF [Clostridia bacterium]|nr:DNA replication/repair protein RecF [Clostridia bacterium]
MYIKKITLSDFRNYENQIIEFDKNLNIIYGNNAQGKTNIIEAIFLSAMGKSFRAKKDKDLIRFGSSNAKIDIEFEKTDREGKITVAIDDKKTFFVNGIKQNKISDIIGKINVVIFTPDDIDIIKEGPARRRKFIDMMISSLKPNYIHILNNYNKTLEQRNSYLRQIKYEKKSEKMLDIWDEQLSDFAEKVFLYRKNYVDKISNKIKVIHKLLTKSGKLEEEIQIKYISTGKDKQTFLENLKKSRAIDISKGYTSVGIHRDDLIIYINNRPVNVFGSQGQQRTSVLSLKLTELNIVKEEIGESPILLLDDFMSELDKNRRESFLEKIEGNQVIITCTDNIENTNSYFVENGICIKNEEKNF